MSDSLNLKDIVSEDGTYTIPVRWSVYATVTVEADNLEDAVKIAKDRLPEIPLSSENEYIDDSYEIDGDEEELINAQNYRRIGDVCIHRDKSITRDGIVVRKG